MKQQQDFPVFDSKNYQGLLSSNKVAQHISTKVQGIDASRTYQNYQNQNIQNNLIEQSPAKVFHYATHDSLSDMNRRLSKCPSGQTKTCSRISDEIIKGQSRIQYVPYEKRTVDYIDKPKKILQQNRKILTDYHDHVAIEYVPKEVTVTDYYAVEHIRCYVPEIKTESIIEYIPVQRKNCKREYIPVERQIVHYPVHSHDDQAPRYLGVAHGSELSGYENVSEEMYNFWEQQYGYKKGESIDLLNLKIREKYEKEKKEYFQRVSTYYTQKNSRIIQGHYIKHGPLSEQIAEQINKSEPIPQN